MKKGSTFIDSFLKQVKENPDNSAVMDRLGADTYRMLCKNSAYLAGVIIDKCNSLGTDVRALRENGESGARIAILLPRSRQYITALIAIVRAGCVAMPVDSEYPKERISSMIESAGCILCVTTGQLSEKTEGIKTIIIDDIDFDSMEVDDSENLNLSDPDIEGLIIFTSGSTGKPKGVLHKQSIFSSGYELFSPWHNYTSKDIIGCMAGFTFIASVTELIPPLFAGGSIYILDDDERLNADKLYQVMTMRNFTGMYLPPQLYDVMRKTHGKLPLEYVFLAGEKVKGKYTDDSYIVEGYGSSETSGILYHRYSDDGTNLLGKAQGSVKTYLLDDDGNQITVPEEIGELCVVSPWLSLGYLGIEKETKEKFCECPFEKGTIMYHTGDFMSLDNEGNLHFSGRKDRMIKLRGFRVELGEIENVLNTVEGISESAVVAVRVGGADKLCAYYSGIEKEQSVLKKLVGERLPDYMVPDYTVWLENIPRNDRNKVDYGYLKTLDIPCDEGEYLPPETELEIKVCDAFADALGAEKVSVTADFFSMGGTSLSVSVMLAALGEQGKNLSFQDVVKNPTPRELAVYIEKMAESSEDKPEMDREYYPLTKTQMGIYLEAMTGGSGSTYSSPYLMEADPSLDENDLIGAVNTVIAAHPSMKYVIRTGENGIPYMFMEPDMKVDIPVYEGTKEGRLDFMKGFYPVVPLTEEMLVHFAVYKTPECCYLAMKCHLIFIDGTSISLVISELNRALEGRQLLPESYTIQQVAMHEERLIVSGAYDDAKTYYKELFSKMDEIPSIGGDLEGSLTPGVSENLRYEPGTLTAERVNKFCTANQITESGFFIGAMSILLGKYLNSKHISFSTVYNGRAIADTKNTIGTLIKRIPVYGNLSEDMPVGDYLRSLNHQVFENMSNDIFSFDEVLKSCPVNEDVELIYQGDLFTDRMGASSDTEKAFLKGDKWFMEQYHTGMVTGCFSIQVFSTGGLFNMTVEYRNERFSKQWVTRFAEDLFTIAQELLTKETIGSIEMLTEKDREILSAFNDTRVELPFVPVHEQIHNRAENTPEKTAITAAGKTLTFRELDLLTNKLAKALQSRGTGPESLVGVLFDRTVWAYVAEIGILKAGGAFVPFIPDYPDERISFCMEDGKIPFLLTSEDQKKKRTGLDAAILTIEELFGVDTTDEIRADDTFAKIPEAGVTRDNLAYCIYTSGTTGKPKGVMIEHGNIFNYVSRNEKSPEIMHYAEPGRTCLALASFSFDVSVVEEFVPLCNGNGVVIATEEEIHDPSKLAQLIIKTGATGITCTPTYLQKLLDIEESRNAIEKLTFFDIGAEAFPAGLYNRLRELRDDSVILNVYGPTEATMGCAAEVMTDSRLVTVGPPIANTYFYVSDTFGNELPVGIKGELIICGDQVGRGYINLPDKTAKSFFVHNGMRAYHSGDLASWTQDGKIRIFGRIDNQIKLRGFRIELDEIEKVMEMYPGVATSAATVKKGTGAEFLAGYYVASESVDSEELKSFLQTKLPEYMVPTVLVELKEMPRTINEKIDRRALPDPDIKMLKPVYVAPDSDEERAICEAMENVLKLPANSIGLLDDFFNLGGDSLSSMIVVNKAGIKGLTGADVFQYRTPGKIAAALKKRLSEGDTDLDKMEEEARKVPHILTPMQTKMLDMQLHFPGAAVVSTYTFLVRFDLSVDAEKLCEAVNRMLKNRPALSMKFFFDEDFEVKQQFDESLIPEVKVKDILPTTEDNLADILVRPFDKLLNASLCRVKIFRGRKGSYLFMDVHHLLTDGASLGPIFNDIVEAYNGRELKKDYYLAFLAMEEKKILSGQYEEDKRYHEERYGRTDWCAMLYSKDLSGEKGGTFNRRLSFNDDMVKKAEEKYGVTLSVILIGAVMTGLYHVSGEKDIMVPWLFSNRMLPEAEESAGMYVKLLTVGCHMDEIKSMKELLLSINEQVVSGIAHSTYDYNSYHYFNLEKPSVSSNLQVNMGVDSIMELHPEPIELDNVYKENLKLLLRVILMVNEYGDGGYDFSLGYDGDECTRKDLERLNEEIIKTLEEIII